MIGPPKIEIHQGYDAHAPVNALCGILAGIAVLYVVGYALIPTYSSNPSADKAVIDGAIMLARTVVRLAESPGERGRVLEARAQRAAS